MGGGADGSLGTLSGVVVPTCENMWGVLIFLRFFYVVGHAGVWQSLLIVFICFLSALFTVLSLSAMAGGLVRNKHSTDVESPLPPPPPPPPPSLQSCSCIGSSARSQ